MWVNNVPASWIQEYPYETSLEVLRDLSRVHAARAGSVGEAINNLLHSRDYAGICNFELLYDRQDRIDHVTDARQALAFFQKLEPLDIGVDKSAVALRKFEEAEEQCRRTNVRLRLMREENGEGLSASIASVLMTAQRNIALLLGDVPSLDKLDFSFGPGANTTVKARASSPRFKLGATLACSSELLSTVGSLLSEAPSWVSLHALEDGSTSPRLGDDLRDWVDNPVNDDWFATPWKVLVEIHNGKLQFVPKNAKTYRSIVVEPILNSFAQKGVGKFLKRKLRKVNVNLSDQTRNQDLARVGSLSNSLATVDLSSASDTISIEVVALLLPLDWFSFLSRFRTGKVDYKGKTYVLEKFSSMGNAFTFELESLIFWALAKGVCTTLHIRDDDVSVYGDDIIIPTEAFELLKATLEFCGFSLNTEKSYHTGPFRESCGADWHSGIDVRPFYQKSLVSAETLFTLHNFYARRFEFDMCAEVVKWIHPSLLLYGPDGYGDGHLIGGYDPVVKNAHAKNGWSGVVFETFSHRKVRRAELTPGDSALPAYSIYMTDPDTCESRPSDHRVVRGSKGYRRTSIYTLAGGVFLR